MTTLDLYHRTSEEAARAIVATGRFLTRENTPEAYVSTHVDGDAVARALNSRPRKTLGWRTPAEAFNEYLQSTQQAGVATTG